MKEVQYIDGFRKYADGVVKKYAVTFMETTNHPRRHRVRQLELSMHKIESELNTKLAEILQQADETAPADIEKMASILSGVVSHTVKDWIVKNIELMNTESYNKRATVLR